MTNEMHNSINNFYSTVFSCSTCFERITRSSSGALPNILCHAVWYKNTWQGFCHPSSMTLGSSGKNLDTCALPKTCKKPNDSPSQGVQSLYFILRKMSCFIYNQSLSTGLSSGEYGGRYKSRYLGSAADDERVNRSKHVEQEKTVE